ncbi:13887_t:CDS:2 [Entrophospora sp. SA101]|nr:13887_t:CDS:2 [Entrophospora sp. SA101]
MEGSRRWVGPDFCLRSNDLELFHYLTGGNLAIKVAEKVLNKNLKLIEDLILEKRFVPNPRKPKMSYKNIIDFNKKQSRSPPTVTSEQILKEIENPENIFLKILKHYKIGEIIDKNVDSVDNDDNLEYLKLFSFDLNIYPWILKKFGPSSIVTSTCYNEILSTKFHFDNQNRWYYEDLTDKGWIAKLANLEKSSAKSPCSDIILFK